MKNVKGIAKGYATTEEYNRAKYQEFRENMNNKN